MFTTHEFLEVVRCKSIFKDGTRTMLTSLSLENSSLSLRYCDLFTVTFALPPGTLSSTSFTSENTKFGLRGTNLK